MKAACSIVVAVVAMSVAGCTPHNADVPANTPAREASSPNLDEAEALRIAEAAATSEGYDLDKYNMTGCHYEFVRKDGTWTVFYELKPPTPPGGHFLVSINDQTKEATVQPGE